MIVADFTGKGDTQDLVLALPPDTELGGVTLQLLTANDGEFRSTQTLNLGEGVYSSCAALHAGTGSDDGMYLVMDAWTGTSSLVSDIILYDEATGFLQPYRPSGMSDIQRSTLRYHRELLSRDLDDNGTVDIPVEIDDGGTLQTPMDKRLSFLLWKDYTSMAGGDSYSVVIVDKTDTPTLDDIFNMEFETTTTDENGSSVKETHTLGEFATRTTTAGYTTIARENGARKLAVTSETADGYNTTLLSRELEPQLAALDLPDGVTAELAGETTQVTEMLSQMAKMLALELAFVYIVMVAQFQSLLSPFSVLFTIPLAFTGGMLGLMAAGEQLSLISLMGFLVLMGVVVNNGIVFVDYANQLRIGGLERTDALVATGRTRMRPILMTTLTTVLAMVTMLFGTDMASEMSTGMAIVIIGGLSYATLMTLFVVPVLYDLFYRRPPVNIDVGDDGLDDLPDDAAEFAAEFAARRAAEAASAPRRPDLSRAARAPEENDGEKKEADHDNG